MEDALNCASVCGAAIYTEVLEARIGSKTVGIPGGKRMLGMN
jgi:hypothetical protein